MSDKNRIYYHGNNIEVEKPIKRSKSEDEISCPKLELSLVDPLWETIDPTPNVHELFLDFDSKFFAGKLKSVEVRWSKRMTLCAGVCSYEGLGGLCSIRLSEPLLKLRPRKDLVETLLIFHSFHDEVENYRQHWWQCNGECAKRPPYYGLVRRTMNRAPGPNDVWWSEHQASCNGQFIKIKEPDGYKVKQKKQKTEKEDAESNPQKFSSPDIRKFVTTSSNSMTAVASSSKQQPSSSEKLLALPAPPIEGPSSSYSLPVAECPICEEVYPLECMNDHLDNVHFI